MHATVGFAGQSLVDRLCKEENLIERERRSVHRRPLVRPVTVTLANGEELVGFSKNISSMGLGLIVDRPISEHTTAVLKLHSLKNNHARVRSEVRWCQPFGDGWFLTGWKFIAEVRG